MTPDVIGTNLRELEAPGAPAVPCLGGRSRDAVRHVPGASGPAGESTYSVSTSFIPGARLFRTERVGTRSYFRRTSSQ